MAKLLIVESPAKSKTISKFLGGEYAVMASGGHIVDLPASKLGVDVANDFHPDYTVIQKKKDLMAELKKAAKQADAVFLATDPDREGEAISWHLSRELNIDGAQDCRIVFNEITPGAIREAVKNPRPIKQPLVDAQQARRVLDRLVGYEISPVLWRKVKKGLSAGRVQSVAVRLIVDRERQITAFTPEEYWTLEALLSQKGARRKFKARYHGLAADGKKKEPKSNEEVAAVMQAAKNQPFVVSKYKEGKKHAYAPPPFSTSMLQQEASRKLNFTTKRTMKIAQDLYEGVETGEGAVGLVTYIRTDSLRVSEEALADVRAHILEKFGPDYLPAKPNTYKSKKNSQDAHEAIRPTSCARTPEDMRRYLTDEQFKLYRLIYERFAASQMAPAQYATRAADIAAGEHLFKASSSERVFDGFMAAYKTEAEEEKKQALPALAQGEELQLHDFVSEQHFTEPPARFTEASLVKELEELGIGRPSTYSPIISTILDRQYVEREKKTLKPTPLGEVVTDLMLANFKDIVDAGFTAGMEEKLDEVEEGARNWVEVLREFYGPFEQSVEKAKTIERVKVPVETTDIPCEKCGAMLVVRSSRFGKFLACPNYPTCKNTKPLPENEVQVPCPKCGGKLLKRFSKATRKSFFGCSNYPQCNFAAPGLPTGEKCPHCDGYLYAGFKGRVVCNNPACPAKPPREEKPAKKEVAESKAKTVKTPKAEGAKAAAAKKKPAAKATAKKPAAKKPVEGKAKAAVKKTATKKAEATKE